MDFSLLFELFVRFLKVGFVGFGVVGLYCQL